MPCRFLLAGGEVREYQIGPKPGLGPAELGVVPGERGREDGDRVGPESCR